MEVLELLNLKFFEMCLMASLSRVPNLVLLSAWLAVSSSTLPVIEA